MKRILTTVCAIPLLWSGASLAQEADQPNLAAVEIHMCNFNKGKDADDMDKVVDRFNAHLDKIGGVPYSAWTLTPRYGSPDYSFDMAWLGVWQDGAAMGKGLQEWKETGGDIQAAFDQVVSCDASQTFTSANYKPQVGGWPKEGVTVFSDCSVGEDSKFEDAIALHTAWTEHLTSRGSKASMWAFYPSMGGNNEGFDYKIVVAHPDYVSLGADNNDFTNGGGWRKAMEMGQGVVSCNTPRVYESVLRRDGGVNPN